MTVATLAELLERSADRQPDAVQYVFLDANGEERPLTRDELRHHARHAAALLAEAGARTGDRALLLAEPGFDFVASVFGCLLAGVIGAPAYPPHPARLDRTLPRLLAMIDDCEADFVVTSPLGMGFEPIVREVRADLRWIVVDTSVTAVTGPALPFRAAGDVALLQYTSGSTSAPRGVMLTNANLDAQLTALRTYLPQGDTEVSWLPPYHDMGLMLGVLRPVFNEVRTVLMAPETFLRKPLAWLEAISRHHATTSGGPNFAYELCIRKIKEPEREKLDLRSWRGALNGAEPIRAGTLEAFSEAYACAGFDHRSWLLGYGLAEATLMVSAAGGRAPLVRELDAGQLQRDIAVPAEAGLTRPTRRVVSSGVVAPGHRIVIVDPGTREQLPPWRVGEIWAAGDSMAAGYWRLPDRSSETFDARLAGGEGPFLRTGDLGFVDDDGELYVTGRIKDIVIIRGRNLYPSDIEVLVEQAHEAVRGGCVAAFGVDIDEVIRLVVVAETVEDLPDPEDVVRSIRRAIIDDYGDDPYSVVLLPPRTIPKTSSGKIQRSACREAYVAAELPERHRWQRSRNL